MCSLLSRKSCGWVIWNNLHCDRWEWVENLSLKAVQAMLKNDQSWKSFACLKKFGIFS